jgi:hypothetical protein
VSTPEPPARQSPDLTLASTGALSGLALIPLVGGVLQPWAQEALAKGQRELAHQFYEEVAETLRRQADRLGHVELEGFLARREAAAALNETLGLAARTASREKHRLLAQALVNSAAAMDDVDPLLPQFWSMIARHSALDVKLLNFLSDPVNLAIRAGYEFEGNPYQGECLFAVLPELRHGNLVRRDGYVEFVADEDDDRVEEDNEEYDGPEHDPATPPGPYFLFWHSMKRLFDDDLIEPLDRDMDFDDYLDSFQEMELSLGQEEPMNDGLYPGRPFESLSELGARYLAFVSLPA